MEHATANDNKPLIVIERDPKARDIPCCFCGRTKRTHPNLEFATDGRSAICTQHVEEALFLINNVSDRADLSRLMDNMRKLWQARVAENGLPTV
ncbi:MAG TPA: hypothetical protein VMH91_03010 [Candidatus Paceibacterota bacterium]|nr:hypothetical protein [Candidatus Paceibacterota bacterium]